MRFTFAFTALSAALSVVSAATFTPRQLPNCAAACLAEANYGGCNSDDDTCLCNSQVFIQSSTQCIQQTCTGSDLTTAESDAQQLCLAVGVTLTSSTPAATGSSAASSPTPSSNGATANKINALAGAAAFVALAAIL
ncbi:hypothetical protein BJ138DRAFT_1152258 [Hygrophoropsis aurantiaca]|uniref:Uncharacterized protein n=1 Tax=Hygrophoropsis aurantiaca TaxID=72124 RepID=A0ACB8ABQ8_9AGAM|nr:hypothetical protein BJ138DRAFT_1152258 [Hygrophoropsis aurantiaca]